MKKLLLILVISVLVCFSCSINFDYPIEVSDVSDYRSSTIVADSDSVKTLIRGADTSSDAVSGTAFDSAKNPSPILMKNVLDKANPIIMKQMDKYAEALDLPLFSVNVGSSCSEIGSNLNYDCKIEMVDESFPGDVSGSILANGDVSIGFSLSLLLRMKGNFDANLELDFDDYKDTSGGVWVDGKIHEGIKLNFNISALWGTATMNFEYLIKGVAAMDDGIQGAKIRFNGSAKLGLDIDVDSNLSTLTDGIEYKFEAEVYDNSDTLVTNYSFNDITGFSSGDISF